MDLCSVDFYVERAKISRTFNHGAFWNKLNIYPSARLGKKIAWEFFFVCSQEKSPWEWRKKEKKKKSSNAIKYVGVFLLIYSRLFWCRISVEDFEAFPTLFSSKREKVAYLIIYFCPLWHFPSQLPQEIADWVLSFWARLSFPLHSLSHTHKLPQWAQSSLLKTSQCNKTWSNIDSSRAFQICFHR